jgi:hypothetical protein
MTYMDPNRVEGAEEVLKESKEESQESQESQEDLGDLGDKITIIINPKPRHTPQ